MHEGCCGAYCLPNHPPPEGRNRSIRHGFGHYGRFEQVTDIVVMRTEQFLKQAVKLAGHPSIGFTIDSPVFALEVQRKGNVEHKFFFYGDNLPNRVTKAMTHAVEVCGGSQPEPF